MPTVVLTLRFRRAADPASCIRLPQAPCSCCIQAASHMTLNCVTTSAAAAAATAVVRHAAFALAARSSAWQLPGLGANSSLGPRQHWQQLHSYSTAQSSGQLQVRVRCACNTSLSTIAVTAPAHRLQSPSQTSTLDTTKHALTHATSSFIFQLHHCPHANFHPSLVPISPTLG